MDAIWTTADQPGNKYGVVRHNIELQAIVAVLTAGPVGISDGVGFVNASLARSFCRTDGALLIPSYSATPLDSMYGTNHPGTGELWQAHTAIGARLWLYVLAVDIAEQGTSVAPSELWPRPQGQLVYYPKLSSPGCANGSHYLDCIAIVSANHPMPVTTGAAQGVNHSYALWNVAPMESNGYVYVLSDYVPDQ